MKYNFSVIKSTYVDDYGRKEKISQETLATFQVYLPDSITLYSPNAELILSEKLARMIEKLYPGLKCSGIALDYFFTDPIGNYGPEEVVFSLV